MSIFIRKHIFVDGEIGISIDRQNKDRVILTQKEFKKLCSSGKKIIRYA